MFVVLNLFASLRFSSVGGKVLAAAQACVFGQAGSGASKSVSYG